MFWFFKKKIRETEDKKTNNQNTDWRESPAHLALLGQFTRLRNACELDDDSNWESVLGESPVQAIARFSSEGLLRKPTTSEYLESNATVPELKVHLKERKLKLSGRKSELAERLVEAGFHFKDLSTENAQIWMCTDQGKNLAREFYDKIKEREEAARGRSLELMKSGKIKDAIGEAKKYYSTAVNYRGQILGWNYDLRDIAERVKKIKNTPTPLILEELNSEAQMIIKEALCMSEVWSEGSIYGWLPTGFETGFRLEPDVVARMYQFSIHSEEWVSKAKNDGFKKVKILGADDEDSCPACKAISGKKYVLSQIPELPLAQCTCGAGCRCEYLVVV